MTSGEPVRRAIAVIVVGALVLAACGSSGGGSVEAFCESAQKFVDLEDPFGGDPAAFADGIDKQKDAMNTMIDDAPSEISDDIEIAVESFMPVLDALADVDPTDEDAVSEAFAPLDETNPDVEAAADRVDEFALAECGIDLDA
jgi:hypothetical protein